MNNLLIQLRTMFMSNTTSAVFRNMMVPLLQLHSHHVVISISQTASAALCNICCRTMTSKSRNLTRCHNLDMKTLNKRIYHLITSGRINEAKEAFDKMEQRNVVTWNSMLTGYVKRREMAKARKLFDKMPERDVVSWNLMILGYVSCGGGRHIEEGRYLFDQMPDRDCTSWNTMISGYAKNGRMDKALRLFNNMPERNVVTWNAMITGFLQNGDVMHAIWFFKTMPERDGASISALVSGLIKNGELDQAEKILIECRNICNVDKDLVHAYNTLIAGYGQRGRIVEARQVFDQIPFYHDKAEVEYSSFERNVVSWNTMIMCYVKAGDISSARKLFDQMKERDTFSWNTMISGYVHMSDIEEASCLFGRMPDPDTFSWNTMISGFAQIGKLERAHDFFERTPQKNLVSWNSMISGYEKNEDFIGAVAIFSWMQMEGEKHDQHTLSSILSASTGLVDLHLGMQIHQLVTKTVFADVPLCNSLITMYGRCGAIKEARSIFDDMELQKDVISWNAMIGGYASHGFATEALELFKLMKKLKIQPTYITFIAVLNSCAHVGLVEEGRGQFNSMINDFGIEPRVEHYASLVDIIGRHGQLQEAMHLVNSMPLEPDKSTWGALLGACRVHNNVELARIAAEALMKIEPESSAPYVLLYNMYADLGRWDDAEKVRLVMEENNIKKQPGYSRVES